MYEDLIYLVSCTANGEKPDAKRCAGMDPATVFEQSRRHSLTVMAAAALEQTMPLPSFFTEEKYKVIRRFSLYQVERTQILNELEQNQIWYLPLKGIVMANDYPKKSMRQMSDNDILYDAGRQDEVKSIMERLGYTRVLTNINHHDVYQKGDFLDFEMHQTLLEEDDLPALFAYYRHIKERLIPDDGSRYGYHMSQEDFYVFMICHAYKHYISCGTGLRFLLDVYIYRQKHGHELDWQSIREELSKLHLLDYEEQISELSGKVFTRQALSPDEQRELELYTSSNTHGTLNNLMSRQLGNDDSPAAKQQYALKRIFPTGKELKKSHPVVARYKFLYPFLVIYRPVKGVIKHRKMMFGEIRRLKNFHAKKDASPERKETT